MVSFHTQNLIGKKVLLVDDQLSSIDVLVNALKSERFNISLAFNGKQALESINANKPDLVLLDVIMPEMGGFEVCRILKADESTSDIPLIFITAKYEWKDIEEGFAAGCGDYIIKPFLVNELCSRIRTHLILAGISARQKRQRDCRPTVRNLPFWIVYSSSCLKYTPNYPALQRAGVSTGPI